jgi:Domain of unknown function (DUF4780)
MMTKTKRTSKPCRMSNEAFQSGARMFAQTSVDTTSIGGHGGDSQGSLLRVASGSAVGVQDAGIHSGLVTATVHSITDAMEIEPIAEVSGAKKPKKRNVSGAQQRKRRKQRLAQEAANRGEHSSTGKPNPKQTQLKKTNRMRAVNPGRGAMEGNQHGSTPGTSHPKRLRSDDEVQAAVPKKPRKATYAQITSGQIGAVITDTNHPEGKIEGDEKQLALQKGLLSAFDSHLEGEPTHIPNYRWGGFRDGRFHVTCEDTFAWGCLMGLVGQMQTPWAGAKLEVMRSEDLPRLFRCSVWVPGIIEEPVKVLKRLGLQHKQLRTRLWKVYHRDEKAGKGQLLILGIDQISIEELGKMGRTVFCGFSQLVFNTPNKNKNKDEGGASELAS